MLAHSASCLAVLTLISISSSTVATRAGDGSCQEFYDEVYCHYNSSNCTVYVNQTVTFVCNCVYENCTVRWEFHGNTVNGSAEYNVTVTNDTAGVITCYNGRSADSYKWNVTVLQPKPPKFMETPSNHEFNGEIVHIGNADDPTCYICVNCSVTGSPAPVVTWEYQYNGMADYSCITTNQSDASSPYFVKDNGQKLCFNDIRSYHLIDKANYQCNATNVGGSRSGMFNVRVIVYDDLPQAGPTATRGSVSLKGENVTLTMYAVYNQPSAFRLCLYNKSTSNSCCNCDSSIQCKWGELSSTGDPGNSSCQFTTSHPAVYQFQILTKNYHCYFDIGESIDVVDDSLPSSHDQLNPIHIVAYCVGGLLVLLLAVALTVIMYLVCRLHQRPQARLDGVHHDANNELNSPLLPADGRNYETVSPDTTITRENSAARNASDGGIAEDNHNDRAAEDEDNSSTANISNGAAISRRPNDQVESSSGEHLPLQVTDDDTNGAMVPSATTCKDLTCKKKLYLAHGEDSKLWVTETLIPVIQAFNIEVVTICDAIPGKTYLSARADFIKEACKMIVVVSEQSVKDKTFLHDISKAQHKNPDPTKILIIPILFRNVTLDDVPTSIRDLIPISYDSPDFVAKIKLSIDS